MINYLDFDIQIIINNLKNDINFFKNKTILISGGAGFLGKYFV